MFELISILLGLISIKLTPSWNWSMSGSDMEKPLQANQTYQKELMDTITLEGNLIQNVESDYHEKIWTQSWKDTTHFYYEKNIHFLHSL